MELKEDIIRKKEKKKKEVKGIERERKVIEQTVKKQWRILCESTKYVEKMRREALGIYVEKSKEMTEKEENISLHYLKYLKGEISECRRTITGTSTANL